MKNIYLPITIALFGSTLPASLGYVCIKGGRLESGQKLYRNQYVCASDKQDGATFRIGLDEEGELAQYKDNTLEWTLGKKGSVLEMRPTGVLLLRNQNGKKVWTNNCYAAGAFLAFNPDFPSSGARTIRPTPFYEYASAWQITSYKGEDSCTPPIFCKGHTLKPGEQLSRNEYICPDNLWTESYRFGLNNDGQLGLFKFGDYDDEIVWTPKIKTRGSHALRMKKHGNLVLTKKVQQKVWASGCASPGNVLQMSSGGILIRNANGDVSWYVDYDGKESKTCNPAIVPEDRCAKAAPKGRKCRMYMYDSLNDDDALLQVKHLGNNRFSVTDNARSKTGAVAVNKTESGALYIDAGVPEVTCKELLDGWHGWQLNNDTQLTFLSQPKFPCTEFGENLIMFMINEWFFFG